MRISVRLAAALAALSLLVGVVGPTAHAGTPPGSVGIKLLDAPIDRVDDPRAKLYIVDHLAPGTTISRRIQVTNATDEEQLIKLYPGAASLEDGKFIALRKRDDNDLVAWTTVDPAEVTVRPGESTIATVTIAVPAATSAGERYGAVWAELPPNAEKNVTEINRVGIRMYISVGEGGEPVSDFTIGKLTPGNDANGRQLVAAEITNTGGRAIDVTGELRLSAKLTEVGPFRASTVTLAPAQSALLTVPIKPATTRGPWNAELEAASGLVERTARARFRLPAPKKKIGKPVKDDSAFLPTALIVGAVAAVPVGAGLIMFRQRSRHY